MYLNTILFSIIIIQSIIIFSNRKNQIKIRANKKKNDKKNLYMKFKSDLIQFLLPIYFIVKGKKFKKKKRKEITHEKTKFQLSRENDLKNSFNVISFLQNKSEKQLKNIYDYMKYNYSVAVFNLNGTLNVGSIMRSATVYGCSDYYLIGRKRYDMRSCVGSNKYVNIKYIRNVVKDLPDKDNKPIINYDNFIKMIEINNLFPIFIEQGGKNVKNLNWNIITTKIKDKQPCFIFGNESHGIDSKLIKKCKNSFTLSIPQCGILRSHNVSTAAGIILWEYYKNVLNKY